MKIQRTSSIVMAAGGLLLVGLVLWAFKLLTVSADAPRQAGFRAAPATGVTLHVGSLAADETIELTRVRVGHGPHRAQTFITKGGTEKYFICTDRKFRPGAGPLELGEFGPSQSVLLTDQQVKGLDLVLGLLREQDQFPPLEWYDTYEITYRRGAETIGSEKWIDYRERLEDFSDGNLDHIRPEIRVRYTADECTAIAVTVDLMRKLQQAAEESWDNPHGIDR